MRNLTHQRKESLLMKNINTYAKAREILFFYKTLGCIYLFKYWYIIIYCVFKFSMFGLTTVERLERSRLTAQDSKSCMTTSSLTPLLYLKVIDVIRTRNQRIHSALLHQLSYNHHLMDHQGLEPRTFRLWADFSNQLK